ncbi:hypothetical protein L1987_30912 [Smallanthus sonchifolius]|uniref:Uncharacterized protein n=1 Tax=Smallanthus sonchifolius TaxID=185202 RepID=A0ACB9I426_9ASTR|nr:hypothetical protein L1987_30912 [Smallanthus sonchifolius]
MDIKVPPPVQQDIEPKFWCPTPWNINDDFWSDEEDVIKEEELIEIPKTPIDNECFEEGLSRLFETDDDSEVHPDEPRDEYLVEMIEEEQVPSWESEFGYELGGLLTHNEEEFDPLGELKILEDLLYQEPSVGVKEEVQVRELVSKPSHCTKEKRMDRHVWPSMSLEDIRREMKESEETRRKRGKIQIQRKPTPTCVSLRHQRKLTPHQRRPTPECFLHSSLQAPSVSLRHPSVSLRWVSMDRNYHDNQYYYEPCSNCGITGHWAQDCPRYNQCGGGPEYPNYQDDYNQDYHPSGPPEQDNYQSELDVIRSDMKEMSKVVHAVMQQQESQAKAHQTLIDLVSNLSGIVGSLIKEVVFPPVLSERDPTQDERWEKFENHKINLPFFKELKENSDSVECLKGLSTRKRRHKCPEQVKLSASVNVVFTGTFPPKLQDPGTPIISIHIGEIKLDRALLDLGASVSIIPGSLYDQHDFGPLQRVNTTVVLADQTPAHPRGIVKDVIVKVGEFYYPVDFLVLDCVKDTGPTIILGRPFLATAQANINCAEGTVRMRFGAQKMSLKIFSNLPTPKANKCGSPEKVNHTVENACVVFNRSVEMKNGENPDKGKKRVRKRRRKGKKPRVHDVDQELFSLFMKAWRKVDDERNLSVGKEDCKHLTRPP